MTQPLDELWGRFDVDFPNNRSFLTMPVGEDELRGKAYLLLLALSGWSVQHRTDGAIPLAVVIELASRLWPHTGAGLLVQALYRAKLAQRTNRGLLLRKQSKWQRTSAEVQAAIDAGRRGATKRWGQPTQPNGVPQRPDRVPHSRERERARERARERTEESSAASQPSLALDVPDAVHQVFEAWVQATGKTDRTVLNDARRKLIQRRLAEYPLPDLQDAVRGWRHDPWEERPLHTELEVLLRPNNLEKFRDMERHGPPATAISSKPTLGSYYRQEAARLRQEEGSDDAQ